MKKPLSSVDATKKRKNPRDAATGQFAESSSLEPHELLRIVRAIKDLEPFLASAALAHKLARDEDEASFAMGYAFVGSFLANIKALALRDLCADPDSLKEAKKLRLDAKNLGNLPLQEQERIRKLASDWMMSPDVTPMSLFLDALKPSISLQ